MRHVHVRMQHIAMVALLALACGEDPARRTYSLAEHAGGARAFADEDAGADGLADEDAGQPAPCQEPSNQEH